MIITIDGPAGAGKSSAARGLARRLGLAFLDTGATYRAATLHALARNVDVEDEHALAAATQDARIELRPAGEVLRVIVDGRDVTEEIRTQRITNAAHHLASRPAVRRVLVELQRRVGRSLGEFVTEGRDQGSVVFPHADVKFYLDAQPQERARRRREELLAAGEDARLEDVLRDIIQRDERDRNRQVGPLIQPPDAIILDNSRMTQEQTLDALEALVRSR